MEAAESGIGIMGRWQRDGAELADMIEEAAEFNRDFERYGQALLIYGSGALINGVQTVADGGILADVAGRAGDIRLFGRTIVSARDIGPYRAVFYEAPRFMEMSRNRRGAMFNGMVSSFVVAAVMMLFANVFLTRFVFKRILNAMDTLTYGVHQIRDGNLDFRIEYRENDEFSPVCDDFNEMAGRLLYAREAMERDERSRRELIAGISHDLRTPLTSIKAYVEGLEQGVASTPEARTRYMDTIKNKANDLEQIIEKLFLFSKLDTGEFPYRMERVDLRAVASEIVSGAADEYSENGLHISVSGDSSPVFVNIDAMQMRRVLINIFENSLKYRDKEHGRLVINVGSEGREAVLTISDDGPGVPSEAVSKLFGLFYRIDGSRSNPSRGSGLGLAIAAKMVAHFGGKIAAKNPPSGGLSIEIRLPTV
jgi:signal transduction histidine kinase